MDRAEYLKKYRVCNQCLGEYEDTLKGLEDHIYNSLEHNNYINVITHNKGHWWEVWK